MIAYFPVLYPDELIYSVLCRYHQQSGATTYVGSLGKVLKYTNQFINIEFINKMLPEGVNILSQEKSFEITLLEHTMFPYYSRFLPSEKKRWHLNKLRESGIFKESILPTPKKGNRFLKYCPVCVKKDRVLYGETYWHRSHQLPHAVACYEHGCKLKESSCPNRAIRLPQMRTAEESAKESEVESVNSIEWELARYYQKMLNLDLGLENKDTASDIIREYMKKAMYIFPNSSTNKLQLLLEKYTEFYNKHKVRPLISDKSRLGPI